MLGGAERPHRMVGVQHRSCPGCVKLAAVQVDAPVVDRDPHVVDKTIDAGKVEIDEATDVIAMILIVLDQHVVAE